MPGAAPVHLRALAASAPSVFWLDRPERPDPEEPLIADSSCDLAIVGAGFTGLWAALRAIEANPGRDVVVLDAQRVAYGGTGRNGGFCDASLTHGIRNGADRFTRELAELERLGNENLDGIEHDVGRLGIDAAFERTGFLDVATAPWQLAGLHEAHALATGLGHDASLLDRAAVRAELDSPTFEGGLWTRGSGAVLDPAALAWGLADAIRGRGVRLHEHTPVMGLEAAGGAVALRTPHARLRARKVLLATNAFPPLLRRLRSYIAPVYDYVLMTEPLSDAQLQSIGWRGRQGVGDAGNQFHYYRLTADDRILWGGYDAIYHYGGRVAPELEERPESFALLARHFFETFPQLEGLRFTHRWAGAIDVCSRFCAFYGTAYEGRVAYALGYTGLGVGASRFGARVALDHLDDPSSPLLRLGMVRSKPLRFPPEPLRYAGIELTRRAIARADASEGRRGLLLRALDRAGMGFDS